jgi:hypothetical protein
MLTDRYGLALSTQSAAARDAYVVASDLLLSANPGPVAAFDRAIAADPGFALAYAGKARALQLLGDIQGARAAVQAGNAVSAGLPSREASHLAFHDKLIAGQADAATEAAKAHLAEWPRDALVLSPCSSVFGLIGFSGRAGREREQVGLLDSVAPAYGDDWWFNAQHAFGLMETGQRDAARPKIERAVEQNPGNANAAHIRAHMYYEDGEQTAAHAYLADWLTGYSPEGLLHGHITWHLALCALQEGDTAEAFRLYAQSFAPGVYQAGPLFVVADAVSFLWRAELAGAARDTDQWRLLHDYAHKMFPHPAIAYADTHIALADAVTGDTAAIDTRLREMQGLADQGKLPSGPVAPALAHGFEAFLRADYTAAIDAFESVFDEHERIGGSRAQRDLVEFTLLKAYLNAGRLDDARRRLAARRAGPRDVPVAGLKVLH